MKRNEKVLKTLTDSVLTGAIENSGKWEVAARMLLNAGLPVSETATRLQTIGVAVETVAVENLFSRMQKGL